jgi:hypothetical protein
MAREYSHEELTEMVVGKTPKANAVFYEKARLMIDESKAAGHRVYEPQTYIKLSTPGVTDVISYRATAADIKKYPEEYEYYMQNRQGVRETVPVSIIPNVSLSHMQELIDLGLSDIRKLAEADLVPSHLEYARQSAIVLNRVLQEQRNAFSEEESYEESPEVLAPARNEAGSEVRNVPAPHRPEHAGDVGQRQLQEVRPGSRQEPPAGNEADRPQHDHKRVNPANMAYDWKVELVWRP